MGLTDREYEEIEMWVRGTLKCDFDLFDLKSEVDRSLTKNENITILEEKINVLAEKGTLNRKQALKLIEEQKKITPITHNQSIDIVRILKNDMTIVLGGSNSGKTMLLCNLITDYRKNFTGDVHCFGFRPTLAKDLKVKTFSSLLELEQLKNSIIVIDELNRLFDLNNRKKHSQVETILRMVNHNGNKLVLCGLPTDFKKFLCAKASCIIYKKLNFYDLINGSMAKLILEQYAEAENGVFCFGCAINEALCWVQEGFWKETVQYKKEWDTKYHNPSLFVEKNVPENAEKKGIILCPETKENSEVQK